MWSLMRLWRLDILFFGQLHKLVELMAVTAVAMQDITQAVTHAVTLGALDR